MPQQRTAISVPEEILEAVDLAAREKGLSRSAFITRVLRIALQSRKDALVTRKLNELFADEALAKEQLEAADELDSAGTRWDDERW